MALAVALGLVVATSRMYGPAPLRWAAVAYIEFFRGIPVLLLLYFLYYGLPEIGSIMRCRSRSFCRRSRPPSWASV